MSDRYLAAPALLLTGLCQALSEGNLLSRAVLS